MIKRIKARFAQDNLEYEFLPPAIEIESTPPSPLRVALIWIIFILVVVTLAWSYFGRVDEVAVARGRVIPDGRIKVVQPLETGVIRAIHVKEGQEVKEGQVLIELDPTIKQADVESTAKALSTHLSDRERLLAELQNRDLESRRGGASHDLQRKLKEARESEYKAKEEALGSIIAQRENALQAAEAILVKLEKNSTIVKEQEAAYKALYDKGYTAKMDYLDKQKEYHTAVNELEAQRKIVKQSTESLEEAKKNLDALKREREKGILADIVDKERNIIALSGEAIKARKRYDLERLCSPVDGTVHGLSSYTVGGVLTPAQPTVTIVPHGTPLIIEAMAQNKDIGFLRVGQEAEVKLDTFPFQKYGTLKGKVVWLSPDAIEDEKLGPVYKMKVELEKMNINIDGKHIAISPGMALTVEVKTNKRRIIEFFLSPVVKYASESLTLR
ncbi:MAG: HlyD family type I secretion periplasmic adaptor subunit [Nitrospirota bacterium]